jgi:predicted amidophosphoribosyltransferase
LAAIAALDSEGAGEESRAHRHPVRIAFCASCGRKLPGKANFCPACGRAINTDRALLEGARSAQVQAVVRTS